MSLNIPNPETEPTTEVYDLTLVVACYNEKFVLESSISQIVNCLECSKFSWEIIFIDDTSSDGTPEIIRSLIQRIPNSRAVFHAENQGRGATVTDGIKLARGRVAGYIDIDLATAANYIVPLTAAVLQGVDVAMAWRIYKVSPLVIHRWVLSRGYHYLMRFILGVRLKDTETGCKFFRRQSILPILEQTKDTHWFWDTEICTRCYFEGLSILELPTLYLRRPETGTTVKIFRDSVRYLVSLLQFAPEARRLRCAYERRQGKIR